MLIILDEEMRTEASREIERMGRYQLTMYLIVSLPVILAATYSVGYVFTADEVHYRSVS